MVLQAGRYAIVLSAVAGIVLSAAGFSSAAQAASAAPSATARIQSLLNNPVSGTVNLPRGTFTVRPDLVLRQGERIVGHHTTLKVASGSGNYAAVLAGATTATDLSGLTIAGVTFDQNASGNPISSAAAVYNGKPRFVVRILLGSDIKIVNDRFIGTDNVNTVVPAAAPAASRSAAICSDHQRPLARPLIFYTSGTGTMISGNTLIGRRPTTRRHRGARRPGTCHRQPRERLLPGREHRRLRRDLYRQPRVRRGCPSTCGQWPRPHCTM